MKACLKCGTELTAAQKFCPECGTKYVPVVEEAGKKEVVTAVLLRKMIYSVKEAATSLNISPRKLQMLINSGEITVCRNGGNVGVTEWALEEFARKHEEGVSTYVKEKRQLKII